MLEIMAHGGGKAGRLGELPFVGARTPLPVVEGAQWGTVFEVTEARLFPALNWRYAKFNIRRPTHRAVDAVGRIVPKRGRKGVEGEAMGVVAEEVAAAAEAVEIREDERWEGDVSDLN